MGWRMGAGGLNGSGEAAEHALSRERLSRMTSVKRQSAVGRPGCAARRTLPSGSTTRFSSSKSCTPGRSLTYTGPPLTCTTISKRKNHSDLQRAERISVDVCLDSAACGFTGLTSLVTSCTLRHEPARGLPHDHPHQGEWLTGDACNRNGECLTGPQLFRPVTQRKQLEAKHMCHTLPTLRSKNGDKPARRWLTAEE